MTIQLSLQEPKIELVFTDETTSLATLIDADTVLGTTPGATGLALLATSSAAAAAAVIGAPTGSSTAGYLTTWLTSSTVGGAQYLPSANAPAHTGDVTSSAGSLALTIATNVVTYSKFQQVAASSIVGNPTGALANAQGITLGATLTFSGSALQTAAHTGDVTTGANSFATTIATGAVTDQKASLAVKPSVRAVSVANIASLSGVPAAQDGVTLAAGEILLLTAQTTASQNGPWTIAAGAWTRPVWWPNAGTTQAFRWSTILVREGTLYAGSTWFVSTSGAITIDTTSVAFTQVAFAGGVSTSANNTFTGSNTFQNSTGQIFRQAATQDGILLRGRAGGSSSFTIEFVPTTLTASRVQTAQDSAGTLPLLEINPVQSFRNKIINGEFRIWQRGNAITVTHSANIYSADRFFSFVNGTGATMSAQNATMTPGTLPVETPTFFRFLVTVAGSGSTTTIPIAQRIEDARTLANKRIVISFYAKADTTRNYTPRVTQSFGTGGSPSADVTTTGSAISVTTSWTQYTQAITVPSISGKTFGSNNDSYLQVDLLGPNNVLQTFVICLLEDREAPASEGTLALPWELRPYATEFGICQRYYETGVARLRAQDSGSATVIQTLPFKATKRAVPTVTGTGIGSSVLTVDAVSIQAAGAGTVDTGSVTWTASAEL